MRVTDRITKLLKERNTLSLGVAKDQLVIEGVATDSNNPLLRELAGRLHRHHLGALSFHHGVSPNEIFEFLNFADDIKTLMRAWIPVALVPDIPRPALNSHGSKGSGKLM